ncbi:Crp/Fnr family transcriptional regulator [Pedobacter chinensis]|uniref:Crp/Fnr family transcriptional regulator n=1 Tax=Pedobacter chinensis TaxID=2282421 RepID=A0A369PWA4_9SPHI|nr:Crp/Fnr family transcriptional regulator [Pedobacter chinensis]RDC56532.1 Crp/Fnr family transcriptional regulator [Pedobacter chinensis]
MKDIQPEADAYLRFASAFVPNMSDDQLPQTSSTSSVIELKKKDFFLLAGKVQKVLGFVAKGLARAYFIDSDGNEITVGFFAEGDYATDYPTFIKQQPSRYIIQCLEPSKFICIPFDELNLEYRHWPNSENYRCLIAEEILDKQQLRLESFIFQRAEERYLDFIKQHPGLFNRISLSHLCSYLGIERQTLTRIRQRLAHR